MTKNSLIILLGCIIFFTPFLGIPRSWKSVVIYLAGALVVLVAYLMRSEGVIHKSVGEEKGTLHVENNTQ